jgi:hypothetical protein
VQVVLIILAVIIWCFSFVLFFGAPYLPTLSKQIDVALGLAKLNPGDTIIELGCGDGRVLLAAAKSGLKAVGFELNPILFVIASLRTLPYRKDVKVVWGNFWHQKWPKSQAIYVFLLPRLMNRLDAKIASEQACDLKIISFAFEFPDRQPIAEKDGVFLYLFKAK